MGLDIRIPLGLIFLVIGGIMAVFGLVTHGDAALYARSLDVDINLAWGAIMVLFGAIMFFAGKRKKWQDTPADPRPWEKGDATGKAPH
jgi:uncharacterized membrane protein YfcA